MGIGSSRMIMGNLLHELFQSALHESMKKRKITSDYLKKEMIKLAGNQAYDIIQCGISIQKFLEGTGLSLFNSLYFTLFHLFYIMILIFFLIHFISFHFILFHFFSNSLFYLFYLIFLY